MSDFEDLASQHKDAVYRLMVKVCGNREDAEDVLIEALLKAYQAMEQLREPSSFRAWLTQIAKRVCFQLKRREALQPLLQLSDMEYGGRWLQSTELPPDQQLQYKLMAQVLDEALDAIPPVYREIYELRDVQQLSGEEVAQRLGITLAAQKSRLHRARALVRDLVDQVLQSDETLARSS